MSESFGGLKDFSVDAQRRMFIEQQERERQAAETKKASRKAKQAFLNSNTDRADANAVSSGVALSGLMSNLENNNGVGTNNNNNTPSNKVNVGEDDDDSIGDDWSLDSEESFYVGIERADYAQPNNLDMYGEEKEEDKNYELKEDRFGISRVSIAIINREGNSDGTKGNKGKVVAMTDDWDVDIPIHDEKSSSLHEFMNGTNLTNNANNASSKKDNFVAMPIVGSSLDWKEESKLTEDDNAAIDQVYEHKAAEGKAFIDKIVNAPSESTTPGKDGGGGEDASTVASMACPPTTPGATMLMTPGMKTPGGGSRVVGGGNYPVISPMALFSPGLTTTGGVGGGGDRTKVVEGEDNALRQMRERELRKEASNDATRKMRDFKKMIATKKDGNGKVDAYEMMKMLEKLMDE
mmetsp:Transcript_22267/g.46576  ORF Transcript_22267/g.46576 Transcript_22267/m.46576 type:complete len:407 (-) Transcript_22267:218-1438(-)